LSLLEYRHGRLQIPLFQDVFWQELERQLRSICPEGNHAEAVQQLRTLFRGLQVNARGGIVLVGLSAANLQEPFVPIENEVRLAQPTPLDKRWSAILLGLAKPDGAVIMNDKLAVTHFGARLKATGLQLPPLAGDELGSGTRHQATREITAYYPDVLGICISTDGPISLYRTGRLISRLY
jgi:DNA integrity scanning protein DisA with diadenylate cyclase activity